jgi:predicted Zn-dependent peptidase
VGTRPDNVTEAMEVIAAELRRIATDPVDADELSRAKENVKGRLALSLESTLTRMNRLGGSVLMGIPVLSLDEMVDRIDAVTADEVTALADELFAPQRLSAAGVGGDEEVFVRALEPVSPELAAAA